MKDNLHMEETSSQQLRGAGAGTSVTDDGKAFVDIGATAAAKGAAAASDIAKSHDWR